DVGAAGPLHRGAHHRLAARARQRDRRRSGLRRRDGEAVVAAARRIDEIDRRKGMTRQSAIFLTRIAVIVGFVALIEILCRTKIINPLTMIPPSEMASVLWELIVSGKIWDDIVQTFSTVGMAFVISVVMGFILGTVIHALPRVRRALDPLLASYYSIPFF